VLRYHTDIIGHVPERHPINFQYKNPPAAPAVENIIIK
jgi:hypothetical protein